MSAEIMVALLSLAGTAVGSIVGILTSNKLTNYRIRQLEIKVDKHNTLIERMTVVEQSVKSAHHRISALVEGEHTA